MRACVTFIQARLRLKEAPGQNGTILNGKERQNYPVTDMFFPPHKLAAAVSRDMTLMPGDIIACGTSLGVGVMREANNVVEIVIDGVGKLTNPFNQVVRP
jgi:2-keto-4-pentenoate hydratase/2-oxohepta-3-ene-1,7-dioic acid hydratase in catechol pathway